MRGRRPVVGVMGGVLALLATGPGHAQELTSVAPAADATSPVAEHLALEAEHLVTALLGSSAIGLVLVLVLLWGLAFALRYTIRRQRWTSPSTRPLLLLGSGVLALLLTLSLVARHVYSAAPWIATLLLIAGFSGLVFGLAARLRSWLGGLVMLMAGRVRQGDVLEIQGRAGTIEALGLFWLTLRGEAGDARYLPVAELADSPLSVSTPRRAYPVEVQLRLGGAPREGHLKRLRALATLCPYRDPRSEVLLQLDAEPEGSVRVHFRAWSSDAARHAALYLHRGLEQAAQTSIAGREPEGSEIASG
ncbi:MAG: mechanosensitive ion channel domain-containing protein [Pseudomonadota bacterium]